MQQNRGMVGAHDGVMRGWGWFRTKKYVFLSIILSRNALYIGRNPVESVLENFIFHDIKVFSRIWGSGAGMDISGILVISFFAHAKWTVLEAQTELGGPPQHATLGDV